MDRDASLALVALEKEVELEMRVYDIWQAVNEYFMYSGTGFKYFCSG